MTKVICDLCGKQIQPSEEYEFSYEIEAGNGADTDIETRRTYDIHAEHIPEIIAVIEAVYVKEKKKK